MYCQFDISVLLVYFVYSLEVFSWVLLFVIHRGGLVFILDYSNVCMGYVSHTPVHSSLTQNEVWWYSPLFLLPFYLLITFLSGKTSFHGVFCLLRGFVGLVGLLVFVGSVLFGGSYSWADKGTWTVSFTRPSFVIKCFSVFAEARPALRQHGAVPQRRARSRAVGACYEYKHLIKNRGRFEGILSTSALILHWELLFAVPFLPLKLIFAMLWSTRWWMLFSLKVILSR